MLKVGEHPKHPLPCLGAGTGALWESESHQLRAAHVGSQPCQRGLAPKRAQHWKVSMSESVNRISKLV